MKQVLCVDINTYKVLKVYPNIRETCKIYNLNEPQLYAALSRKGRYAVTSTVVLMYESEFNGNISPEVSICPIMQYDKRGVFMAEYVSLQKASDDTGVRSSTIKQVCDGKKNTAGGFQWRYKNDIKHPVQNLWQKKFEMAHSC